MNEMMNLTFVPMVMEVDFLANIIYEFSIQVVLDELDEGTFLLMLHLYLMLVKQFRFWKLHSTVSQKGEPAAASRTFRDGRPCTKKKWKQIFKYNVKKYQRHGILDSNSDALGFVSQMKMT